MWGVSVFRCENQNSELYLIELPLFLVGVVIFSALFVLCFAFVLLRCLGCLGCLGSLWGLSQGGRFHVSAQCGWWFRSGPVGRCGRFSSVSFALGGLSETFPLRVREKVRPLYRSGLCLAPFDLISQKPKPPSITGPACPLEWDTSGAPCVIRQWWGGQSVGLPSDLHPSH